MSLLVLTVLTPVAKISRTRKGPDFLPEAIETVMPLAVYSHSDAKSPVACSSTGALVLFAFPNAFTTSESTAPGPMPPNVSSTCGRALGAALEAAGGGADEATAVEAGAE